MNRPSRPPSVDALSRHPDLAEFPNWIRVRAARTAIQAGRNEPNADWAKLALLEAERLHLGLPRPAINMSGIVLHTGLGRARLAPSAALAVVQVAQDHAVVEFDLDSGKRGDRQDAVRDLLRQLTGAEDALVVNNCAAAVLLTLTALAQGQDVVLSRGQMVEIGGAFRMPEIVRASGCRLVEVGCTNKTRLSDFEEAISDSTGVILRCHTSNYRLMGFTGQPQPAELAELGSRAGVPFVDDLGSGCLVDTTQFGLPKERTLGEAIQAGADVVLASGDKLLGGPQAGLILGKADLIRRIAKHPMARAMRIDKLTLAGLAATLKLYLERRETEIPVWQAVAKPLDEVRRAAQTLAKAGGPGAIIAEGTTELGGGSMPEHGVPTWRIGLTSKDPDKALHWLRNRPRPIIGYISDGVAWLDPRTAEKDEIKEVAQALSEWRTTNGNG